jgi:hypothetical protein
MALKVFGSGLGRTGTMSLKRALEQLGFGPCHHMVEVFMHPESVDLWVDAAEGRPDWETLFKDYVAAVDHPACEYWRQLADYYPDAKVIHTVRDPDQWFDSNQATIFAPGSPGMSPPPSFQRFFELQFEGFHADIHDRAAMTDYFRRHNEEVLATIPKDRLLVYPVGAGWGPLCDFLGVPAPDTPYPRENSREVFAARLEHAAGMPDPETLKAILAKEMAAKE